MRQELVIDQTLDRIKVNMMIDLSTLTTFTIYLFSPDYQETITLTGCSLDTDNQTIYKDDIPANTFTHTGKWLVYGRAQSTIKDYKSSKSFPVWVTQAGGVI